MGNQHQRRSERERQAKRRNRIQLGFTMGVVAIIAVVAALIAQGGGDDTSGPALSATGMLGRTLADTRHCSGCHGRNGEGGDGPKWVGLFGTTVQLQDGSTVVADREYLAESIREPNAKLVTGYGHMAYEAVSETDIEAIVQYIVELTPPTATTPSSGG